MKIIDAIYEFRHSLMMMGCNPTKAVVRTTRSNLITISRQIEDEIGGKIYRYTVVNVSDGFRFNGIRFEPT